MLPTHLESSYVRAWNGQPNVPSDILQLTCCKLFEWLHTFLTDDLTCGFFTVETVKRVHHWPCTW